MIQVRSSLWCVASPALAGLGAAIVSVAPAWASAGAPAPLAGAVGPVALLAAGAGYGLYRLVKHFRNCGR